MAIMSTLLVMPKEKSVQSLLMLPNHPLGSALQRAFSLRSCNQRFQQLLPKHLINKVNILNIRQQCVIIGVENASLMTQLHFEANELLSKIKQLPGMQLAESIQFKVTTTSSNRDNLNNIEILPAINLVESVNPDTAVSKPSERKNSAKRRQITRYAGEVLRKAAKEVKDPSLQSALLNISKKAQ